MERKTILIVEDDPMQNRVLAAMLAKHKYENTLMAFSGEEAMKEISGKVDLVISDLNMPGMGGIELCRQLRSSENYRHIPIVMVTAMEDEESLRRAFDAGANDYIRKPINVTELVARVRSLLTLKDETDQRVAKEKELADSYRSIARDLKLAKSVQTNMLPVSLLDGYVDINGIYHPSEDLGGDMYYWEKMPDGLYQAIMLDVMGHGVAASLVATYIRSLLPDLFRWVHSPSKLLAALNHEMFGLNKAGESIFHYFTAFALTIDCFQHEIRYVNAGHPAGLLMHADGAYSRLGQGCMPIGIEENIAIEEGHAEYGCEDFLVVYPDGVYDFLKTDEDEIIAHLSRHIASTTPKGVSWLAGLTNKIAEYIDIPDDISVFTVDFLK